MESSYLWHQQKQSPDNLHNPLGDTSSSPGSALRNGVDQSGHGAVQSQPWEHAYDYGNEPATSNGPQAMSQSYYDPSWNLYDFQQIAPPMQSHSGMSTISPATLLAQRVPNGTNSLSQGALMDAPTTIDPTLMMTTPFSQYISPTQTQYLPRPQSHHASPYQQQPSPYLPISGADSTLEPVVSYEPLQQTIQTPPTPSTASLPTINTNGTTPPLLVDQVKKLLTPKQLDRDPQSCAQRLIDLLIPPPPPSKSPASTVSIDSQAQGHGAPPPPATSKDTRMEILTRLRDHAPKEFFVVFARNAGVLALLREWGKNACKKEEFEETLMGWLQVVDKLPLTVEALAQSGLGKLIKYVVEHPPTTAIKDMATKIETGWKKAIANEQEARAEADRPKKRKLEASTAPQKGASITSNAASSIPATKKAAVVTSTGVKVAVRKDSPSLPTTGPSVTGITASSAPSLAPKGAQSDSGFFSAKPKAKLPSFRKKPAATATTATGATAGAGTAIPVAVAAASSNTAMAAPTSVAYTNPFEDAMKSLRKSSDSPALPSSAPSGNAGTPGVGTPPGISAKTGKLKKKVKFDDKNLERILYIERAVYDDGPPGIPGFRGQSYRDLDRAEGNLLKHMLAQIDWYEPPPIDLSELSDPPTRGERSTEAKTQADREASTLAAFYQGAPPDTPVEPPQLASFPLSVDDSGVTIMLLGSRTEEEIQGGSTDTVMSAGHWLGQLGMDSHGSEYGAMPGTYGAVGQGPPLPQNTMAPAQGQEGIADILNKLMKVVSQPESGTQPAPAQPAYPQPYGINGAASYQPNSTPAPVAGVDSAAIISALTALGMLPATQPPPQLHAEQPTYGPGGYGDGTAYGGAAAPPGSHPYSPAQSGLPPPLHTGIPGRDEQEERWRRSAKGDGLNGKKMKKDVPASQNTWKPLCTFFARGKCRFGEDCDFSHDPSKLPK